VALNYNIQSKKALQNNLLYFSQLRNWVGEEFPVLIRDIEKRILSSSAHHFNSYFKEWFHELVEDKNIEVEIKTDDFQPIIHVNGYESPFKDLSGGEKSALSLAYRLALNKIINERYQEVKTKDLLILDEPTDGFSQQQINRMQFIFEKLNISQMIIISHERNLDSFVTDIFQFKKENHITRVLKDSS
jgi:exonuclease SbcC